MSELIDKTRDGVTGIARWVLISAAGGVLLAAGFVMLFTPGPGLAAILLGLYLLSKQFRWARRAFDRTTATVEARREQLPAFVGRLLDEKARRRQLRRPVGHESARHPSAATLVILPQDADADA